jgi:hypothetical protein
LTFGRWLIGSLVTGLIVAAAVWLVIGLNRRDPLGSQWPSVGPVRPGLGVRTVSLGRRGESI